LFGWLNGAQVEEEEEPEPDPH